MLDDSVPAIHIPDPFARMDAWAFRSPIVRCQHQHRRPATSAGIRSGHAGSREEALPVPSCHCPGAEHDGIAAVSPVPTWPKRPRRGQASSVPSSEANRTLPGNKETMPWIPPHYGDIQCHNSDIQCS